ncbi:hypothetical protein HDV06_004624 [Boothiomyces sp. JEL0866]|nr:hypothetical protein HDV06_004624 [Boothiomyces sp. JEL0866]
MKFLLVALLSTIVGISAQTTGSSGSTTGSAGGTTGSGNSTTGNTSGGTTSGGSTNSTTGNSGDGCDPTEQLCPNVNCDQAQTTGLVLIASPNSTTYYFTGNPINITYTFTATSNPNYPKRTMNFYYRPTGTNTWTAWGNATKGTTTIMLQLNNVVPGNYDVLALTDGVDPTQKSQIGPKISCVADGWPYSTFNTFALLQPQTFLPYQDPYPPYTSSAEKLSVFIGFIVLFLL